MPSKLSSTRPARMKPSAHPEENLKLEHDLFLWYKKSRDSGFTCFRRAPDRQGQGAGSQAIAGSHGGLPLLASMADKLQKAFRHQLPPAARRGRLSSGTQRGPRADQAGTCHPRGRRRCALAALPTSPVRTRRSWHSRTTRLWRT